MKKFLSVLLALTMIFAMGATAFAENSNDEDPTTKVTINDSTGRTYVGYQLLELSSSLKGEGHHPAGCNGTDHADDCYNYSYTINTKYEAILQKEVFDNGGNYLWESGVKPGNSGLVTKDQILKYLSNQTGDEGTNFSTMRQVADRVYREILKANIEADAKNLTGTEDDIEQGYWMFADESNLDNQVDVSNSLVLVNTAGLESITITPKTALPTIDKKVKDIEDSEDSNIFDNEWNDTADHDIGDSVPFKLTATLPANAQGYQSYKLIFHDTLSSSFALEEDTVRVLMYESIHRADADFDLSDGADVTDKFPLETENLADPTCSFEIGCDNVFNITGVTKDTVFVVYYEATLTVNATIGGEGNINEAYLEYSNSAYSDSTGKTEEDEVTVFTYQFKINKIDSHGHALEGAEFALYKKVLGQAEPVLVPIDALPANPTTFVWSGIDDGDYILKETDVPSGYNGMDDIEFSVTANHSKHEDETFETTSLDGGKMGLGDTENGIIENDIVNHTGSILPETGAKGTLILISGSFALVVFASVFMITRKKMSVFED